MRRLMVAVMVLAIPAVALADKDDKTPPALSFKMKGIDGKEVDLAKYKGKVVMFVNVASECGLTKQYKQLQALHDKYAEKGLVIVGVPANEFGGQEPGTDAEILKFCTGTYDVKFPLLSKVVVKGEGICPLYEYLTTKTGDKLKGPIKWNFTKFLVNKKGEVVSRFEPTVSPDAKSVIAAVEKELEAK